MIQERATFTFYRVKNAGFYRTGADAPDFGSLSEILLDIQNWAEDKTLKETKTFEADEERYPAYLVDTKRSNNDWVLLLWNEIPSNGQRVPSLSEDAIFGGDPELFMNPIRERSIPGFATYFWFIDDLNLVATVRLHNKVTAQPTLQKYIQCFLKTSSQHAKSETVELPDGSHEVKVTRYMNDVLDEEEEKRSYYPRFNTILIKNPGKHEEIRQKVNFIKKIERILELNLSSVPDLALWQRMLDKIRMTNSQQPDQSTKVRYTVSPDVDINDLNQMINDWDLDSSEVNDYGFVFQGEPGKTYWLSNSLSRTDFDIRFERENDEIVNIQSLLNELVSKKSLILRGAGL